MGFRVGFLFILVLISWDYGHARNLVISHISVMKVYDEQPESEASKFNVGNEGVCSLCERFASQARFYLSENKTQTEIFENLHQVCSRLYSFQQECATLVDYYAPLFFVEIARIHSEDFCKRLNLCEDVAFISLQKYQDSCELCHQAVVEVLLKLRDPDTQLEIIELLLKECEKIENHVKECKKLVFKYGPVILINAEQFLETHDICTSIHACKPSGVAEADSEMPLSDS